MVSAGIEALGGGVWADTVDHLQLGCLYEALEAWMSFAVGDRLPQMRQHWG